MSARPLVSLCIPTYNGERFIRAALASARAQTYPSLEILVVDDASTDGTVGVATAAAGADARIVRNSDRQGLAGNWNACLEQARGQWVKFLFQDDELDPECVERLVDSALDGCLAVCDRRYVFAPGSEASRGIYADIAQRGRFALGEVPRFVTGPEVVQAAWRNWPANLFGEPDAVLIPRQQMLQIGGFDPRFKMLCDYRGWLGLAADAGVSWLPEPLCTFHVHRDSATAVLAGAAATYEIEVLRLTGWMSRQHPDGVRGQRVGQASRRAFYAAYAASRGGRPEALAEWRSAATECGTDVAGRERRWRATYPAYRLQLLAQRARHVVRHHLRNRMPVRS